MNIHFHVVAVPNAPDKLISTVSAALARALQVTVAVPAAAAGEQVIGEPTTTPIQVCELIPEAAVNEEIEQLPHPTLAGVPVVEQVTETCPLPPKAP